MFFRYSEILRTLEEGAAKYDRSELVKTLINQYKALEILYRNEKRIDLATFLSAFRKELSEVNSCPNSTKAMGDLLKNASQTLQTHPEYAQIKVILDKCLMAIDQENTYAQTRVRTLAKNDIQKIKNRSIYTASPATAAIIGGAVLAVFNLPMGLILLGITIIAGMLTQAAFWLSCRNDYAQLHTKIEQGVLESDYVYASGEACPLEDLPTDPDQVLNNDSPAPEEPEPFLFGEKADKILDEIVELVPELMGDAATAARNGFFALCSSINQVVSGPSTTDAQAVKRKLHSL